MKKVVLYGEMGRRFGKYWRLDARTPHEAIRGIIANKPEFEDYLLESWKDGIGFRVFVGHEALEDRMQLIAPFSEREVLRIVPVVAGGGGILQVFAGIVMLFIPGMQPMGVGLILSGVAGMLADHPDPVKPTEKPENTPSYNFSGVVNTTAQGHCVPVCYGELIVGSAVISAGVTTEDIATTLPPQQQPNPDPVVLGQSDQTSSTPQWWSDGY